MSDYNKERVLVVDDEPGMRFVLSKSFEKNGYKVDAASNIGEAGEYLNEYSYSSAFVDIILPDGSGLELLDRLKRRPRAPSVVIMTAEATMQNAIEAMKRGAFDYLTKPFDLDDAVRLAGKIADYRRTSKSLEEEEPEELTPVASGELVGRSPLIQNVFKLIGRTAGSDVSILITGPTGSGKELVAHAFHKNSHRSHGPFVTVNCAAIPSELLESELFGHVKGAFTGAVENRRGKFAQADGGTLLLDEVGETSLPLQAKMLRALQEKVVYPVGATKSVRANARVIAATNRNLTVEIASGRFREDLFHRLNVTTVKLPPLDNRREDIPALAKHFLGAVAKSLGEPTKSLTREAVDLLIEHSWPGNVRELENSIRRAVLMAPGMAVTPDEFPEEITGVVEREPAVTNLKSALKRVVEASSEGNIHADVMKAVEKALYGEALKKCGWNQAKAARYLGVNRNTMMKKTTELNLRNTGIISDES